MRGRVQSMAVPLMWLLVLVVAPALAAAADTLSGMVVSVADGDTLTVLDGSNSQIKVRLNGIDAPERGQPFGTKARDRLAELTAGKTVAVNGSKRDRYGRTLGRVEVEGQDVNRQMVLDGMAWHYKQYSDDQRLADAEAAARAAKRGLWADAAPVPPWEWRASERDRKAAKRQPVGR